MVKRNVRAGVIRAFVLLVVIFTAISTVCVAGPVNKPKCHKKECPPGTYACCYCVPSCFCECRSIYDLEPPGGCVRGGKGATTCVCFKEDCLE